MVELRRLTPPRARPCWGRRRDETWRVTVSSERLTITGEEAAARLGISRGLAYELVRRGDIPTLRLGRRIVVPTARPYTSAPGHAV
jgi:excisionase family DNA binding protein